MPRDKIINNAIKNYRKKAKMIEDLRIQEMEKIAYNFRHNVV